jgi:hypothetical protein
LFTCLNIKISEVLIPDSEISCDIYRFSEPAIPTAEANNKETDQQQPIIILRNPGNPSETTYNA